MHYLLNKHKINVIVEKLDIAKYIKGTTSQPYINKAQEECKIQSTRRVHDLPREHIIHVKTHVTIIIFTHMQQGHSSIC